MTGIGIDLERQDALDRFDRASVIALLERWCAAGERRWCLAQSSPARAAVALLCCKEAVYKAVGSPLLSLGDIVIRSPGTFLSGQAWSSPADCSSDVGAHVVCTTRGLEVIAIAVAGASTPTDAGSGARTRDGAAWPGAGSQTWDGAALRHLAMILVAHVPPFDAPTRSPAACATARTNAFRDGCTVACMQYASEAP